MCNYGGPTGINDDISDGPKVLQYFGNGVGIGIDLPARSAVALGFPNADHVYGRRPGPPRRLRQRRHHRRRPGRRACSSPPASTASGIDENGVDFGTIGITRIVPQMNRAAEALGLKLHHGDGRK